MTAEKIFYLRAPLSFDLFLGYASGVTGEGRQSGRKSVLPLGSTTGAEHCVGRVCLSVGNETRESILSDFTRRDTVVYRMVISGKLDLWTSGCTKSLHSFCSLVINLASVILRRGTGRR